MASGYGDAVEGAAGATEKPPPALGLFGISKSFGRVEANRDVDLVVARGSLHGIVGENGAGKSTLMSILYGYYQADGGRIEVFGRSVSIRSAQDAIAAGIGMVFQHFMLVDSLTVLENVVLGAEGGALLSGGLARARKELRHLAETYGLKVDPDVLVGDLPVGDRQRVEILKALFRGAEILILDEPTGVLTPQETDQLFRVLRQLVERGATVVLITHKLREIMEATDHVSVMRGGRMIAHRVTAETSREELAELMVGRKIRPATRSSSASLGPVRLEAEGLTLSTRDGLSCLRGVDLRLRAGEIVGIAGVSGNGQSELLEVLSGIRTADSGRLTIMGREVTADRPLHPSELHALEVAHIPEDRQRLGLVPAFPAWESAILGYHREPAYNGRFLLSRSGARATCLRLMESFDVRPRAPDLASRNFSGGNQQKLIVAREMAPDPKVLLVGQPTRGVDIGAIEFIHQQLLAHRDRGAAILLVSVELEEILALADRILVMSEGRVLGNFAATDADERQIGLLMANAAAEPASQPVAQAALEVLGTPP